MNPPLELLDPETPRWTRRVLYGYFADVPNGPKDAGQAPVGVSAALPFEAALKQLETIVEAMEAQDMPLETLLQKYEEGSRLAKTCQEKLAQAELKIQQLEKDSSGELKVKPLSILSED